MGAGVGRSGVICSMWGLCGDGTVLYVDYRVDT